MIARDAAPATLDARLAEAAERGQTLEVILVLRGSVRQAAGAGRWRIRLENGRVLTFDGECVVAATPIPRAPRLSRR